MKKLLLALSLFLAAPAHADTISVHTVSNDNTLTAINDNFSNIANRLNGDIDGSTDGGSTAANIATDAVYEINMADDANPRIRANELLGIGSDTVSGGTLTQNAVVESGCVPADDTDLTSDISACIAYVNGYRVSKSATANTYTATRDCYVDLSQTGNYTTTCVTNGATQPAVAANSVRLAKVVTDGTEITTITSLYTTRIPGLIIPAHYRDGLVVSRDSTTTVSILPGSAEINNTLVSKTSTTSLSIATAGDWAGGSSLRASDTFGFVGLDASGNLKLHTTAPTHDNYAVSTTAGKKRYATWSSTVYRILGWFYMDGAASALVEVASNIKEHGLPNVVQSNDATTFPSASTTFVPAAKVRFYNSGGNVMLHGTISGDAAGSASFQLGFDDGGTDLANSGISFVGHAAGADAGGSTSFLQTNVSQASRTYQAEYASDGTSLSIRQRRLVVSEQ